MVVNAPITRMVHSKTMVKVKVKELKAAGVVVVRVQILTVMIGGMTIMLANPEAAEATDPALAALPVVILLRIQVLMMAVEPMVEEAVQALVAAMKMTIIMKNIMMTIIHKM